MVGGLYIIVIMVVTPSVAQEQNFDRFLPPAETCSFQECFEFCEDHTTVHHDTKTFTKWSTRTSWVTSMQVETSTSVHTRVQNSTMACSPSVHTITQNISYPCTRASSVMKRDTGISQKPINNESHENQNPIRPSATTNGSSTIQTTEVPVSPTRTANHSQLDGEYKYPSIDGRSWNPFLLIVKYPYIAGK